MISGKVVRVKLSAISLVILIGVSGGTKGSGVLQSAHRFGDRNMATGTSDQPSMAAEMNLLIWTGQQKYSRRQGLTLNASLVNNGDATVYVDRRMFWTGYAGGLKLEIANEKGQSLPAPMLSDAMMPPPDKDDTSILIALDEGFFYGTSVNLKVREFFPTPGRYSLRVIYKSWLQRDLVAPQLRNLPALWADAPEITSNRLWIQVTR